MSIISLDKNKSTHLMMGNEAVARGVIESGVGVAAGYPGSPSSEVLPAIAGVANEFNIHAEWSVNEKVAMEVAAGASFAGIRSFCVMKQNGANVASDFIVNLNMTGIGKAGMVLFIADDPGGLTSNNEEDSRPITKWLDNPLLEPSSAQEAKDMIKWAYDISEEVNLLVFVRAVARICYTRSNVMLDELPKTNDKKAFFSDLWDMYDPQKSKFTSGPYPIFHKGLHEKIEKTRAIFEKSKFNYYTGPENPEVLVITCGACTSYSMEAVDELNVGDRVGILKLGTTWPLPEKLIIKHLNTTNKVFFVEEIEPFVEQSVMELVASKLPAMSNLNFYGAISGHLTPYNEISTNLVIDALTDILNISYQKRKPKYNEKVDQIIKLIPSRPVNFCAGCPHRASFWSIKNAIQIDGRNGFVCGDVGCYGLGFGGPGYFQSRTAHAMGSGVGVANGLGNLKNFGFDQPVLAVIGDSTFFHAGIPALVNGVYNNANFILIILDNSITAMTGFQPHPSTGKLATGEPATIVNIEEVCKGIGAAVTICDPFDLDNTTKSIVEIMKQNTAGAKVVIMRHMCQLLKAKNRIPRKYKVHVNDGKCLADLCGCGRLCTRVLGCPGIMVDETTGKAIIDDAICVGCGMCADVCPAGAIINEEVV
jgi:indolepyruvate ferredoxin oxidoreductase alpha subunit